MGEKIYCTYYESPIGWLKITATEKTIRTLTFEENKTTPEDEQLPEIVRQCLQQLDEYFRKERTEFQLPLEPAGTDFEKRVWAALQEIPYGKVVAYKDIAVKLSSPNAVRAVGRANGRNPISIIIPCHRVIGRNGKLVGYGGGVWRKEWLLKHEGSLLA